MHRQAALVAVLALLAGCGSGSTAHRGTTGSKGGGSESSVAQDQDDGSSSDGDAAACSARNTSSEPDLLVRIKDPGTPFMTQQLPGGYAYNEAEGTCQTTVVFTLSTVADEPGYCVQVANLKDNPRYNVLANPAPPLAKVIASKGVCGG